MGKNVTIYDVAERSGVSVASVSRVLAKVEYPVSEQTRAKVLRAAKELNYTVNAMGKMLKTQSTREIGVIVPTISNPSYAQLVEGIQSVAIANGYHILLYNSHRDSDTEGRNVRMLLEKRVDGILMVSIGGLKDLAERAQRLNCRLITLEQELDMGQVHVGYDYLRAGELAAEHLIARGHRRIAFVGARLDRPSRIHMLEGCRRALERAGLAVRQDWIWLGAEENEGQGLYEVENGKAAAARLAALDERPTGCVCLNDLTALGVMQGFAARGLTVPGDVSVVGFDNITYGELSTPKLTTIDQHSEQMGRTAMTMMIGQILHPDVSQSSVQLEPELIERGSVGRIEG